MNSSFKVFLCSRPTEYTQLQAVKTEITGTIKELIIIESEGEEEQWIPKDPSLRKDAGVEDKVAAAEFQKNIAAILKWH